MATAVCNSIFFLKKIVLQHQVAGFPLERISFLSLNCTQLDKSAVQKGICHVALHVCQPNIDLPRVHDILLSIPLWDMKYVVDRVQWLSYCILRNLGFQWSLSGDPSKRIFEIQSKLSGGAACPLQHFPQWYPQAGNTGPFQSCGLMVMASGHGPVQTECVLLNPLLCIAFLW